MNGKQPIKSSHGYVMLGGLWTVLYSITQSPTFLGGYPTHFAHSYVHCQVLRRNVELRHIYWLKQPRNLCIELCLNFTTVALFNQNEWLSQLHVCPLNTWH